MKSFFISIFQIPKRAARQGFTLIETLVAVGLFSTLFAIAAGGFVNALRAQRQAANLISAETNIGIAIEQMAREIRTGYLFCHDLNNNPTCTPLASPGLTANGLTGTAYSDLEYYNANGEKVDYALSGGTLMRADSAENSGAPQAITANNVNVAALTFTVFEGPNWNPRIVIDITITPKDPAISWAAINLQTTVSARQASS
ncbi:MAG: prepilin-type N-terminal cleavage/methylation domain-containing protein [Patescibacteria group bacterium]|nr:prepilin-type N-terminal cleavage/methylation domain-containing protein [Patescibacteria group bacterium]